MANEQDLDKLRYLEKIIDWENKIDKGPLSGKEILVFSPGKTGTLTLYHTIGRYLSQKRSWDSYTKKMLHSHNNATVLNNIKSLSSDIELDTIKDRMIIKDLVEYKQLMNQPLWIITSYRDPIQRAISGVFQKVDKAVFVDKSAKPKDYHYNRCIKQIRVFLDAMRIHHPIEEIDPEFFSTRTFDKEKKILLVEKGLLKILVVCLEHSDKWQDILEKQFNLKDIELSIQNQANKKGVKDMYADFRKKLYLPDSVIKDIYYNGPYTKYVKWFYTDQEIETFYNRSLDLYGKIVRNLPTKKQPNILFSDNLKAKTSAKIKILNSSLLDPKNRLSISAKLTNTGESIWMSGRFMAWVGNWSRF